MKPEVTKIFNDLDVYKQFCRENGFAYNEADLYQKKGPWNLMERERCQGLRIENQWEKGAKIFKRNIHYKG